ncbi:hypothetical protein P9281_34945 [Caballeronia sp. LP003]|uniref:hypothetical protein n=1 Tax=Caballeronia sp. LP003 TaxID=3038551 RepID=UPI002856F169|nr:hypothetical protein [Caballeronia sp. LP003]MDR5791748.1 hypothetical protein [Caballeronia sp. LP003]
MTHPLIENHADYYFVLARSDDQPTKDDRFITRAFASSGFDDEDSGDEGIQLRHEETKQTLACDGDTVVVHHPANGNYAPVALMYGDLFLAIQRMGWESAKLHCANDAEEVLHQLASRMPAAFESFVLSLADEPVLAEDVAELRAAMGNVASASGDAEAGFVIGSLNVEEESAAVPDAAESIQDAKDTRWGVLAADDIRSVPLDTPDADRTNRLSFVPEQPPSQQIAREPHHEARNSTATPLPDGDASVAGYYERQLRAREAEVTNLHEIIKQMLVGQSMTNFAAAVLRHDAIVIAHLYAPITSKLELLGFDRNYNIYLNDEYGVSVDGAFLMFTKDVAGPEWVQTLLATLGGRIVRVWQAERSTVGSLLQQFSDGFVPVPEPDVAGENREDANLIRSHSDQIPAESRVESEQPARPTAIDDRAVSRIEHKEMPHNAQNATGVTEAETDDGLTAEQRAAMQALNSTFSTVLREVFKSSNETKRVATRVADLEASGVSAGIDQ